MRTARDAITEWFSFKSKSEREKEAAQYAAWAFPYGEAQRERVEALLALLLPKGDLKLHLVAFLTAKQAYLEKLETSHELGVAFMREYMLGCAGYVKKADVPLYMALVLADQAVGETLDYPTAEQLRAQAEKF